MELLPLLIISLLVLICAYLLYLIFSPKRRKARNALKKFVELDKKVCAWWNLSKREWKESFKNPEIKNLFDEAIAAYEEMITVYPPLPHYRKKLELAKNWYEFVEALEHGKNVLAEVVPMLQQIYRLNCETTIKDAIQMSQAVQESHPEIHADWYSEILMEYYYSIVLNEPPPEEKDVN